MFGFASVFVLLEEIRFPRVFFCHRRYRHLLHLHHLHHLLLLRHRRRRVRYFLYLDEVEVALQGFRKSCYWGVLNCSEGDAEVLAIGFWDEIAEDLEEDSEEGWIGFPAKVDLEVEEGWDFVLWAGRCCCLVPCEEADPL